ncbi:MAG TPA: EEP domain-containing protein [Acidiferrobacteraceae bacterium]|nr:EEP domain-containing protein [Acidiferrobacteraceae bacterium]
MYNLPISLATGGNLLPNRIRLRLLSYNIQAGIDTSHYRQYFTHSWKHVLPFPQRLRNLDRIAELIRHFDLIGLQETDAGSLRSDYINLTEYLAQRAHFPFWEDRTNRRIGNFARHSLGVLSHIQPAVCTDHRLPGAIPGRGALIVQYGQSNPLVLVIVHLALGRRSRLRQIDYICELVREYDNVILMGDLNCRAEGSDMKRLLEFSGLTAPAKNLHTYPSWRPQRSIDHILVSPGITVNESKVLNIPFSDHLPIAMDVSLAEGVNLENHGGDFSGQLSSGF